MKSILFLCFLAFGFSDLVRFTDPTCLTFYENKYTSRTVDPPRQLNCIGGQLCDFTNFTPMWVQCENNLPDTTWTCTSSFGKKYRVSNARVVCSAPNSEGFIDSDSCALYYNFDLSWENEQGTDWRRIRWCIGGTFCIFLVLVVGGSFLYKRIHLANCNDKDD